MSSQMIISVPKETNIYMQATQKHKNNEIFLNCITNVANHVISTKYDAFISSTVIFNTIHCN